MCVHVNATLFFFEFCNHFGGKKTIPEKSGKQQERCLGVTVNLPGSSAGSGGACRSSDGHFQTCWLCFSRSRYVT